ncbi:putative DTW domain [Monocercomonoides exilis]|uniref:putative DTW domain n=1 Tax=Monocercomonoides exilis TaxID=2049356 RepID=UPI0035595830|nr:putative DTW domain [Monocercomonoides exilis]|eukprot:MONOS_12944.1-p1 / transcript=MONOS_12944.1 / gene=MONOS_12944 / organism=Monocercomonoides_exilis_PA203 / gene_product=DTW domain containing 1, putative / transcript_product=DTW domain containing 1, putative / location=Mono_scaffold00757:5652-6560(+) / protein_length=302 / sequence_SO=supercontig / SO=protein_coding / is_pseudo=false
MQINDNAEDEQLKPSSSSIPSSSSWKRISSIPEESELSSLKIASFPFSDRQICHVCKRSSLAYCPYCRIPHEKYPPPQVVLPIKLDIVKHPKERVKKSTAIHAKIISPDQTNIWDFPDIPTFDPSVTLCLFPSADAKSLDELDLTKYDRAVFIDCTWNQTGTICQDPRITALQKVKIKDHRTLFWRYQHEGPEFLATIEAIYYFFKEFWMTTHKGEYNGELDNLLYYYAFQYEQIQSVYVEDKEKRLSRHFSEQYIRARRSQEQMKSSLHKTDETKHETKEVGTEKMEPSDCIKDNHNPNTK